MNKILSLLLLLSTSLLCHAHGGGNYKHSDMLASMKPGDKAALLMVTSALRTTIPVPSPSMPSTPRHKLPSRS